MPLRFDEIWGLGGLMTIGYSLLGLFLLFALLGELVKLVGRQSADFVGLGMRFGLAVGAMAAIPVGSLALSEMVMWISGHLLASGKLAGFQGAFNAAMGSDCDRKWYEIIAMLGSIEGHLFILSTVTMLLAMVVKVVVIDIAWPAVFAIEVFQGAITIPLNFLKSGDGLKHYLSRVVSVALWPVIYALIYVIIASAFPATIKTAKGEAGKSIWTCGAAGVSTTQKGEGTPDDGSLPTNSAGVPTVDETPTYLREVAKHGLQKTTPGDEADRMWSVIKFLALIIVSTLLTLQVPQYAGRALGIESPPGLLQLAGSAMKASKGLPKK